MIRTWKNGSEFKIARSRLQKWVALKNTGRPLKMGQKVLKIEEKLVKFYKTDRK